MSACQVPPPQKRLVITELQNPRVRAALRRIEPLPLLVYRQKNVLERIFRFRTVPQNFIGNTQDRTKITQEQRVEAMLATEGHIVKQTFVRQRPRMFNTPHS